ncbi:MAG: 4Fe-4S dicluster domain-containing protein [Deltaproteobacteria bacterium]|nr:MAG: 4Fe-4S dicluster domain-containing protein [Deltaproteobacteria bacterium]
MELQVIEKSDHDLFVQNLINNYQVEGVKRKNGSFIYGPIKSPEDLCLDFDCTKTSPTKMYFLPPEETLLRFTTAPSFEATQVIESNPFIIFGVHPYDIKAINQMDQIFADGLPDPHYLKRREAALIIGVDPTKVTPRSFWADMEADAVSKGFDLLFTDIGIRFVVEIGTEKGRDLLSQYGTARPATKDEARERLNIRSQVVHLCRQRGLTFPKREIPNLLERSTETLLWEEKASKCLNCGTCNLVCPTCYCFDIRDDMELDFVHGERIRRWDGCLLQDFAKVATGENFRETRAARYRHRFHRKGLYLFRVLDDVACVGCGRCASACLADIADPVDVFNRLKEGEQ